MSAFRKISWALIGRGWIPGLILGAMCLGACHHHHDYDDRDRVVVVDEHGYRHEGRYDADRHWHGGWYDEHNGFHEDPYDWRR